MLSLSLGRSMKDKSRVGYILIAPAIIIILLVIFFPIINALSMSIHKIVLTRPEIGNPFIGLANYLNVITSGIFWNAVYNTIVWVGFNLGVQMVAGISIAILLNNKFRGRGYFRGLMLIPWATPSVVAVLSWRWMFDAQFGIINSLMMRIGILESGIAWLGNPSTAMSAVIIESIWKGTPFVMVIILAGLQTIPQELYDAARVDGAGVYKSFKYLTLPLLKPTVMIAATLTIIYTFNNFNSIWLMTEGGPLRSTETLTILVYTKAFRDFNFGEASALGIIILILLLLITLLIGRNYFKSQIFD